jgi:eukaryotic-like serine/threonine-protein kinase
MIGRVVGNYRIVEQIGVGGMGTVYRALDVMLEREVALKAILPELASDPHIVERFRFEAKALARVNHPAIATIYSLFYDGADLFLAMEYVPGRSLSKVLRAEGAMPWQRAVPLFASALDGIEQAHRAGIVHRDLKPDNLMLTAAGTLKVMDFGIARAVGSGHLTRTGLLVGTLRYMAPEQIRGEEVDRRTDVYALGAVLYEMLTGRVPFEGGSDYAILRAQVEDSPLPPRALVPALPDWLERAVLTALAKSPADRFQSVEELRAFLALHAEPALATGPLSRDAAPLRRGEIESLPTAITPPRGSVVRVAPPPAPAPATAGGSYRAVRIERPRSAGWKLALVGAGLGVLLVAAAAMAWRWYERAPESAAAGAMAQPSPASQPAPSPATTSSSAPPAAAVSSPPQQPVAAARPEPPPSATEVRSRPSPRKTPPPVPAPAPPPAATPPLATAGEPSVAAPLSSEAAEPLQEEPPAPGEAPIQELRRLSAQLERRSGNLVEVYGQFLDRKKDGGAEPSEADQKLKNELDEFNDAAIKFNQQLKNGFFARLRRLGRSGEDRAQLRHRLKTLAELGGQVQQLLAEIHPGPAVQHAWQEVRHRWRRVGEILASPTPLS